MPTDYRDRALTYEGEPLRYESGDIPMVGDRIYVPRGICSGRLCVWQLRLASSGQDLTPRKTAKLSEFGIL